MFYKNPQCANSSFSGMNCNLLQYMYLLGLSRPGGLAKRRAGNRRSADRGYARDAIVQVAVAQVHRDVTSPVYTCPFLYILLKPLFHGWI